VHSGFFPAGQHAVQLLKTPLVEHHPPGQSVGLPSVCASISMLLIEISDSLTFVPFKATFRLNDTTLVKTKSKNALT